jgi:hypothetical protein
VSNGSSSTQIGPGIINQAMANERMELHAHITHVNTFLVCGFFTITIPLNILIKAMPNNMAKLMANMRSHPEFNTAPVTSYPI